MFASKGWITLKSADKNVDWLGVIQSFAEAYGWTPLQIDEMTLPEISVACYKSPPKEEALVHLNMRRALSPKERIQARLLATI